MDKKEIRTNRMKKMYYYRISICEYIVVILYAFNAPHCRKIDKCLTLQ